MSKGMRVGIGRVTMLGFLSALWLLSFTSASAFAGTAEEVAALGTLDPLNRTENPLSNGGKWSKLNWAQDTGLDTASGWGPLTFPALSGAYWKPHTFKDSTGNAASVTLQNAPGVSERYLALWLNMPDPGSAKTGYQLHWMVNTDTSTYTVRLSKWVSGTKTVLASNASVSIPIGTTLAISDTGGTVAAWRTEGGILTSLLSASDTTYSSGYAGIEGAGSNGRISTFKAGALLGGVLPGLPVLDNLKRNEAPLASANWSKTSWAGEIGVAAPFVGYGSTGSALAGAYWKPTSFTDPGQGLAVESTIGAGPTPAGQYLGLWLNMPSPNTAKSGYEARVTGVDGTTTNYKVELSKWVAGTRTVLGTKPGASLPTGTTVALTEVGGTLALWTGTSNLSPVVSATDATYSAGYAGLEVNGSSGRQYDFRAGSIAQPPDTTISNWNLFGGIKNVLPDVTATFTSTEPDSTFECSMDGGSYSACGSPKSYQSLSEGSHTLGVRAKNFAGTDPYPTERTFKVFEVAKAVPKVQLHDDLERNEVPLATGKWSKTSWGGEIGGVRSGIYHGYGSTGSNLASAFWNQSAFNGTLGTTFAIANVGTGSTAAGEYQALWLNMPEPGSTKSGYEARFEGVDGSANNYKVELAKWSSGTRTVLASKTGFSLSVGTTMVLSYGGGSVGLWTGTGTYTRQLYAVDTTYPSGYAGIEVKGSAGTAYNFRAGLIDAQPPGASITSGPSGKISVSEASFSFTANEAGSTFECSMDGAAFTACTSPKEYKGLSQGSHQFRVRATDPQGNQQETPTYRNFQVAVPPETTITSPKPSYTSGETPPVTFTSDQAGSTFECQFDSPLHASPHDNWINWSTSYSGSFADVNGDGKADIIGRSGSDVQVGLSTGGKFNTSSQWTTWGFFYSVHFADVNGDSKADLIGRHSATGEVQVGLSTGTKFNASTQWTAWLTSYSIDFADANNDGKADIVGRTPSEEVRVGLSTGSGFAAASAWATFSNSYSIDFIDVNMDGKADLIGRNGSGDVQAGISTGSKFEATSKWMAWAPGPVSVEFADFNGDDRADIVGRVLTDVQVGLGAGGFIPFGSCTSPYTLPQYLTPGWNTVEVKATNSEGVIDPTPAQYLFNPGIYPPALSTSKLVSPEEGDKTSHYYTLEAEWGSPPEGGGVTGVTFQLKLEYWKEFRTIPGEYVLDGKGESVSWPLPSSGNPGNTEPVFFDYWSLVTDEEWPMLEENIKFRAVFDGGKLAAGASKEVTTEFSERSGAPTNAIETVGPAAVDLMTGRYTITKSDVAIPIPGSEASLEFARTYDSSYNDGQPGSTGALGGMWRPSAPVEQQFQGEAWRELRERHEDAVPEQYDAECLEEGASKEECMIEEAIPASDWIELLDNDGGEVAFEIVGGQYVAPDYLPEYALTSAGEGTSKVFYLTDPDGVRTSFVRNEGGTGFYRPKSVSWQATEQSVRMVYEHVEGTSEYRIAKMIAPAPVTCSDEASTGTIGCRTLTFQYFECSCPGMFRLSSIRYYNASGNPSSSQEVAKYEYDANYRLIREWDPRISPNLKETYSYGLWGSNYRYLMLSLTPAGEEPWQFDYYDPGEFTPVKGEFLDPKDSALVWRLKSVSRATLTSPSTAQTTLVYQVPVSGPPYDMSPATVAKWGQSDYPVDATAVFPPTQVPSSPRPTDFSHATVFYMDPEGSEVNAASPSPPGVAGASIMTSETDSHGNTVRSLGPQNRLKALEATDTVTRSRELDSHSTYSADGTEMLESWGPLHKIRRESGATVEARAHTTIKYDEGATPPPAGTPWPHLPTKETLTAWIPGTGDVEAQVSATDYNWTLRKPTKQIIDPEVPGGPEELNLRTETVYDPSTGQVIEERRPAANGAGGTAHTTRTVYYTVAFNPEFTSCGAPFQTAAVAGLPCVTMPAAAPSPAESNPQMPWTWYTSYSKLDAPEKVEEKTNGVLKRTTTLQYDEAGRMIKTKSTGVEGNSVPAVRTTYSSTTGTPEKQELFCEAPESCTGFDTQQLTTTYDKLGRPTEYKDADGNTSKTTYDLMGRPATVSDGKGIQTPTYDEKSGVLTNVVDSAAGTFTAAAYNADGQMTEQILPNGLAQQLTYDVDGTPIKLRYQKISGCSSNCTWLEFNRETSIGGQVLREAGTLATKEYSYDKAGRLTLAKETPAGQGCTTRSYAFDKDSNRTARTTRAPKEGGACDTTSPGAKTTYSYDSADRLIGSGVSYDSLGRITSLPSAYSGGGTLSTSYYVNDLTRSQTQDGLTNTYYLDAARRQRERVQSGTKSGTEVYHYAGGSDSPVWTQEGANWSRNVAAIGGSLGALQKSNGEITFQIADMHGDVVAIADDDPNASKFLSTQQFDEFGNPKQSNTPRFGWLGSKTRRTELPSGVIQMGLRSYVPALGRFLTPDPVRGGSANAYDYANQDPVNNLDLTGECVYGGSLSGHARRCRTYKREKRTASRLSRKTPNRASVVIRCKCGGASASSLMGGFKSMVDKLGDTVKGSTTKFYNVGKYVYAKVTAPSDAYKTAGKAFKMANRYTWGRAVQAWNCGTGLAASGEVGACDPIALYLGEETDSAGG